jgi:predicted Fe-S protein YdhL (DUF1289 family)
MNRDDLSTRLRTMEPIVTPCIRVCVMDKADGHCQGCRRTLEEIMQWTSYTHEQRLEIMATLAQRKIN